jgi:hypothetical protein
MDKYDKAIKLQKKLSDEIEQKKSESLRLYLQNTTSKNITTMSIGMIAEMEKTFGHLWGHGKRRNTLSQNEEEWRAEWNILRQLILDKMHNTINKFTNDMDRLDFRYRTFTFRGLKNGDEK